MSRQPVALSLIAILALALCLGAGCSDADFLPGQLDVGGVTPDAKITPKDINTGLPDGYKLWPCDTPGKSCNAHDPCAVNAVCGQDKQCWPESVMNCNDGLDCTTDTCAGMGLCSNVPKAGYCKLGVKVYGSQTCKDLKLDGGGSSRTTPDGGVGQTIVCCFKKGQRNPADQCQECNPEAADDGGSKGAKTKWSPANGGFCDDGNGCTKGDYCQAGTCKGSYFGDICKDSYGCTEDLCDGKGGCLGNKLKSNYCLISGVCYLDKALHPGGSCFICDVTGSQSAWTAIKDTCMIDGKCYAKGSKHPQGCAECEPSVSKTQWTVKGTTGCYIDKVCKKAGDKNANGCSSCQPTKSTSAWTPLSGLCTIASKCYTKGDKHPGGCAECDPAVSATKWTNTGATQCFISDKCYTKGTKDTAGCAECEPAKDKYGWSPLVGMCKIEGKCHTKGTKHPGGCGECDPAKNTTKWTLTASGQCLIDGQCYKNGDTVGCFKCDVAQSTTAWTKVTGCTHMDLKLPPYYKLYTSSSSTRGFWYKAPVSFSIIGLRVPTDVGTDVQNVIVLRFTGTVPIWPTQGSNFTVLHYSKGVSAGASWINVKIPITKGDNIGIIGARGTTSMRNSYAAPNSYATTIANKPVTIQRLIMQSNLYTAKPTKVSVETSSSSNVSRVEVRYVP